MKKALAPHKSKFDAIPEPIRHQIAHIIHKDQAIVEAFYSKTLKADIDEILRSLHCLVKSIWYMAFNAERPNLNGDHYGYERVAQITSDASACYAACHRDLRESPDIDGRRCHGFCLLASSRTCQETTLVVPVMYSDKPSGWYDQLDESIIIGSIVKVSRNVSAIPPFQRKQVFVAKRAKNHTEGASADSAKARQLEAMSK